MTGQPGTGGYQNWKALFQPDVLAPAEYLERWRYRHGQVPEVKLMIAVLDDAVICYQKFSCATNRRGRALFREAKSWFFDEPGGGLFSFENICQVAGLDADYLRKGLIYWAERAKRYPPHSRSFYIVGARRKVPRTVKRKTVKPTRESISRMRESRR